jgi:Fic family protein
VRAFVPEALADRDLAVSSKTLEGSVRAASDAEHAAARIGEDVEPLVRLLLRAEGVASSYIEGVAAPVVDIVLAEESPFGGPSAQWVAANLAAVTSAVGSDAGRPLSARRLCEWHRTLMTGSPTPERHVGRFRREQGWIGGTDPTNAHLVTPPPDEVPRLIEDLVRYANRGDVDAVTQAAILHAQFELIHPFADGNGRVGRVLVSWSLTRRLRLVTPPPVSLAIAADVGGYGSGLTLYRLGDHEAWIRWFAAAVTRGARAQDEMLDEVVALRERWRARLEGRSGRAPRADAVAWRVIDLMPRRLVLTSSLVARELGVSVKSAIGALAQLADASVLSPVGTVAFRAGRPSKVFVSRELLGLAGSSAMR